MGNVGEFMRKRVKIGLIFKMWLLCVAITTLYDLYFVYYALPQFQTRTLQLQAGGSAVRNRGGPGHT